MTRSERNAYLKEQCGECNPHARYHCLKQKKRREPEHCLSSKQNEAENMKVFNDYNKSVHNLVDNT